MNEGTDMAWRLRQRICLRQSRCISYPDLLES